MNELSINLQGQGLRIGIVLSRFNSDIGDGLLSACKAELLKLGEEQTLRSGEIIRRLRDFLAKREGEMRTESLVVVVNANDIILSGRRVGGVSEMMATDATKFDPLETELKYLASKAPPLTDKEKADGRSITILGDKAIPYEQLKKIMATCVAADYRNIALAVMHKEASNKPAGG